MIDIIVYTVVLWLYAFGTPADIGRWEAIMDNFLIQLLVSLRLDSFNSRSDLRGG